MENKNFKSESYVVREAQNIIERYLNNREESEMKNYYNLKEKYERLKILTIAMFITCGLGTLFTVIF